MKHTRHGCLIIYYCFINLILLFFQQSFLSKEGICDSNQPAKNQNQFANNRTESLISKKSKAQPGCACSLPSPALWGAVSPCAGRAPVPVSPWALRWPELPRVQELGWAAQGPREPGVGAVSLSCSWPPGRAQQSGCEPLPTAITGSKSCLAAGVSRGVRCQSALITDVHRHLTSAAGAGAAARRRH